MCSGLDSSGVFTESELATEATTAVNEELGKVCAAGRRAIRIQVPGLAGPPAIVRMGDTPGFEVRTALKLSATC